MAVAERDTELERIVHLDWQLMCQIQHVVAVGTFFGHVTRVATQPCPRPADWIATCRGCGNPGYLCDIDRQSRPKLMCGKCGAEGNINFDFTRIPAGGR